MNSYLEFPRSAALALRGLLFDLDDTVLDHGRLAVETLATLQRLSASGLLLCAVTGRPAGWGQVVLRQWPVDGVVAENGSVGFVRTAEGIKTVQRASDAVRTQRRAQIAELVAAIQARFPELQVTDDNLSRFADAAFDINETCNVSPECVRDVTAFALERGARVVRSSIHLHVSYDEDDKATGVLHFLHQNWQISHSEARRSFAFIGDSENDAACFAAFEASFGVANLRGRPTLPPRYLASEAMGKGFCQVARHLMRLRAG